MADDSKNLLPQTKQPEPVQTAKAPTKKQISFAVKRVLKKNKFNPLTILINQVLPQCKPDKQADVILALLPYVYPKIKAEELVRRKRKPPMIQVNTQVNMPEQAAQAPIQELPAKVVVAEAEENELETKTLPVTQEDFLRLLEIASRKNESSSNQK